MIVDILTAKFVIFVSEISAICIFLNAKFYFFVMLYFKGAKSASIHRLDEASYIASTITHYSLLITHYSLLITHYSLLIAR
ncbi:hypothetical protein BOQ60_16725 [Chryseobacterium sp. CH1]|nr:hypothetical protein BOQ60_16725 [Chryseobacterium sp. CH1]